MFFKYLYRWFFKRDKSDAYNKGGTNCYECFDMAAGDVNVCGWVVLIAENAEDWE